MKSLGDMNLWNIMGMDDDTSQGRTPPGSNTEPVPDVCRLCGDHEKLCNGTGFYDLDVPVGHPDFSKVFRCPNNPVEDDDQRKEILRQLSNISAFEDKHFDNFLIDNNGLSSENYYSLRRAYDIAQDFARSPRNKWVVFQGTYGCGKTHLAAAIANYRLEQGDVVLFITAPDLLDHLRGSYSRNSDATYDETFDRVRNAELLVLDDLGVENPSDWSKEKLFQLLNHRYNAKLATIITTNADIDSLDPRLRSRMLDIDIVSQAKITSPDYRSAQRNEHEQLSDLHLYTNYNFDNFDTQMGASQEEARNLHRALVSAHEFTQSGQGWLIFLGKSGTGKTHLAAAVANAYREKHQGVDIMFVHTADLLDYLRRTFSPSSPVTFDQQFQQVKNAQLLVLDDLSGVDSGKSWVREKLMQIIKYRYIQKLPTVFTTTQEFEHMDEQLRTRLKDKRLCRVCAIITRPFVDRTNGGLLR